MTPTLVPRPRITALLDRAPVVLMEAPGGYGKSTAARQLAAALDRPLVRAVLPEDADPGTLLSVLGQACRRAGLPSLADALDPEDPDATLERLGSRLLASDGLVLLVDDVQRARSGTTAWLAGLAGRIPSQVRLVLAGRRLDRILSDLVEHIDAVALGADVLRLDHAEIALLLGIDVTDQSARDRVGSLAAATDGWPAAVALAASLAGREVGTAPESAGPRRVLRTLVEDLLQAASPDDRTLISRLARLPLLSGTVVALLGNPGGLDRLLDLGLPVRFRPDGWGELPDPVRELLPSAELDIASARRVAAVYAERDALGDAADLLRQVRDEAGLAALLASAGRDALVAAGVVTMAAVAWELPDPVLASTPSLLVHLVQAAERRPKVRAEWTERAMRLLPEPSSERRAVWAEQALDLARGGDLEQGLALADRVVASAEAGETATLGRARYIRGLLRLVADPAAGAGPAAADVEPAIGLLHAAGERAWEADAWQALGLGCHGSAGRLDMATTCLERALALRSARDGVRATSLTYLAEVLTHVGRLDDAAVAVREAEVIGRGLGDARAIAYAAWSAARLAAERRDPGAVTAALATALANPEGWLDQLAGIEFLADGADMLAVCGDTAGARLWIARAETRGAAVGRSDAPLLARARLEAMEGDPALALELVKRQEESVLAVPRDRWLAWLLRAVCLRRLGRAADADRWLAQARSAVSDQGDPTRPERREPELLALAADDTRAPARLVADRLVVLLGRFGVELGGRDVSPPPGRPATLVKLVALRGVVTLDEAAEALWEDADEAVGRARLRNVLNRVRATCGELIVRREESLALSPGVIVDATRFEEEAAAALRAAAEARVGLARAALSRATGELLPGDRYADWASAPRERITRRHLALLDLVADDAIARGDLDEAGRLLDAAIVLDPLEEERHVRLGRALLRQGRTAAARRVADRAVALCAELDVAPGDELARLLRELARQS